MIERTPILCRYCNLRDTCQHNYDYVCKSFENILTDIIIERFLRKREEVK